VSENINTGDLSLPDSTSVGRNPSPYGVWGSLGSRSGREVIGEF